MLIEKIIKAFQHRPTQSVMGFAGLASLLVLGVISAGACGGGSGTEKGLSSEFSLIFEEFESERLGYRIEVPEGWPPETLPVDAGDVDVFSASEPIGGQLPRLTVQKGVARGQTVLDLLAGAEVTGILEDDVSLDGHDAVRVDVTAEQGGLMDFAQVFAVIDDTLWVLTLVVEAPNRDEFLPIFEHIYESFQIR